MRGGRLVLVAAAAAASVSACTSLTFSNEPVVDFERYPTARVRVEDPRGFLVYETEYLAAEMARDSGFSHVTADGTAATALRIDVLVTTEVGSDDYQTTARFWAIDGRGQIVASGTEEDSSTSADESVEDALDEVSLLFFRPYRL